MAASLVLDMRAFCGVLLCAAVCVAVEQPSAELLEVHSDGTHKSIEGPSSADDSTRLRLKLEKNAGKPLIRRARSGEAHVLLEQDSEKAKEDPLFYCNRHLHDPPTSWTKAKRDWCCENEADVYCKIIVAEEINDAHQGGDGSKPGLQPNATYNASNFNLTDTQFLTFDCTIDAHQWQIAWSWIKKEYCCKNTVDELGCKVEEVVTVPTKQVLTGEEVCEGRGLSPAACQLLRPCCQWDEMVCLSAIGTSPCHKAT